MSMPVKSFCATLVALTAVLLFTVGSSGAEADSGDRGIVATAGTGAQIEDDSAWG